MPSPAKEIQMTSRLANDRQPQGHSITNKQISCSSKQRPTRYFLLPVSSQLQLMFLYSVWESEKSMCNHIHTFFGRRHWEQTWNWDEPLCTERGGIQIIFVFVSPLLKGSRFKICATEVTHFQSTQLASQKKHLVERILYGLTEWM